MLPAPPARVEAGAAAPRSERGHGVGEAHALSVCEVADHAHAAPLPQGDVEMRPVGHAAITRRAIVPLRAPYCSATVVVADAASAFSSKGSSEPGGLSRRQRLTTLKRSKPRRGPSGPRPLDRSTSLSPRARARTARGLSDVDLS